MPRCKALARGGSRRCRRNALKGQEYCSFHGGVVAPSSRQSRSSSRSSTKSGPTVPSSITRASYPTGLPSLNAPGGPSQSTGRQRLNVRGVGIMYRNHLIRTFKEVPRTLVGVGTVEMSARSTAHPTIARNIGYRYALRPVFGINAFISTANMSQEYISDVVQGNLPGTDEPMFVEVY